LCHSPVISGKLQMELPTSYKRTSGPWRVSHLPEGIFLKTNHSGIVWNCWTGALAHLGVARTNALQPKTSQERMPMPPASARSPPTKIFLTLWKDADSDSDTPVLKQANAPGLAGFGTGRHLAAD